MPVRKGRKGECEGCGDCCRLPFKCFFLSDENKCRIYALRPPQCRKFPRTKKDLTEVDSCGFAWKEKK